MEVDGQQEQERPESRQDEVSEMDNESVAESNDGGGLPGTSADTDAKNVIKFKLLSPMGGRSVEFAMVKGQANRDVQEELHLHLTNIFRLGMGIKEAFEKVQEAEWQNLPWSDAEKCQKIVLKLNKCISSVVSLWRGATRPHTESEWFQSPFCTPDQCKKLSFTLFNRVVKNAQVLNKCYKSFSSLTYGETSFDQIQIILDRIKMTEKDVFVDLGSGVGHVVTYASAYSLAKKCVGIEINDVPAHMATKMKKEFENMMSWYGKKYRPFDLIHGDFLNEKYKKLVTSEATVIYINNFAFDSNLMFSIREMIKDMAQGTRIICTKSLSEEREDRRRGGEEGEDSREKTRRPVSGRTIQRQTVDMILDMDELPIADAPVSWSTGKGVQFLLFTVNHTKMAQIYESVPKSGSSSAGSSACTRSGSAESVALAPETQESVDKSISATIDAVISARTGGVVPLKSALYQDEDEEDDDEDYPAPGSSSRKWAGLKTEKRRGRDEEYVPKKRNSTGTLSSRNAKKENKKDKPPRRSGAVGAGAGSSLATSDAAVHAAMHNAIKDTTKVKKEDPSSVPSTSSHRGRAPVAPDGAVILDPSNPMDRHLIEARQQYMDFMAYINSEEAKKRLLEEFHIQQLRNQELNARVNQLVSTVEQLLNAGVQTLNCRLNELEMTDVVSPADILNRSKQIVTQHKDITLQVSAMESQVLALERQTRTAVPYGQAIIEKLDSADFSLEDPYGVLISQACAETGSGEENDVPLHLPDHLMSPSGGGAGGSTPARRPRQRPPRASQARRSGGAAAAAAAAAAPAAGAQAVPGGAKADNDEVERQIAEIVQKALQVDSVAKEKERRARGAGAVAVSGGGSGDRKKSGGGAAATPLPPSTPVTTTAQGPYAPMTAAELLRFQLPSFEQSMDYQHHSHH
ncbi:hypothetical protein PENTCL1PPCAC_22033 [Pristionchus entomophagus]|uniref:Histone-lysine N-methyltransferase, H3 lysine-79 specific n=1 Tax=Pristionchus entomophagus TaxID=358040 RepID=A0AAV5U105_9BILA|nr:hypothetical protein PENTCL1PPCAC_22033 [Pristionchus entomophagus]